MRRPATLTAVLKRGAVVVVILAVIGAVVGVAVVMTDRSGSSERARSCRSAVVAERPGVRVTVSRQDRAEQDYLVHGDADGQRFTCRVTREPFGQHWSEASVRFD
jgi:hypothetical protein